MAALLALSSSWAVGWVVAFHLASDHHHGRSSTDPAPVALALELAAHGHVHAEGTPAHSHPVVGSAAARVPDRLSLLSPAATGATPEAVAYMPVPIRRAPCPAGPSHDPPRRAASPVILRI